jgi:hypothetical protein
LEKICDGMRQKEIKTETVGVENILPFSRAAEREN